MTPARLLEVLDQSPALKVYGIFHVGDGSTCLIFAIKREDLKLSVCNLDPGVNYNLRLALLETGEDKPEKILGLMEVHDASDSHTI